MSTQLRAAHWYAVDSAGLDLSTGRPPQGGGARTPAAALAGAPVVAWPMHIVADDGRGLTLAEGLGRGGDSVVRLLGGIVAPRARPPGSRVVELARTTPAGWMELPVDIVSRGRAAQLAATVDPAWVRSVDARRSAPRSQLGGREDQLEAALHVAMLLGMSQLPSLEGEDDIRAASGSQLWLLGGVVAEALAGDDAFSAWAELLGCGLWPLGPVSGRLVVGEALR